ncbi:uncharacterized protein LOC101749837 isoform X3 [Gallus gallus]|uniref:uncharacterized protein LOC101749837 isoform X3 n=1 Tax=Gallus gallus TaxID=9031 RepID=UPI001F012ECD|nr:uncharacterized protein LOC101749837 isoform X3 [Gallus gallus]
MGGAGGRNEARNERPGRWYGPMRAPGRSAPAPPRRLRETRTAHGDPRVCTSMYVCVCVCVCPCAAPPRRPPPRRSGSGRHMAARRCHQHAKMAALTPPARPCCVTPPPAPPRARRFPGGSAEVGAEDASVPSQRSAAASEAVAVCTGFPKVGFLTELCLLFLQQQMM